MTRKLPRYWKPLKRSNLAGDEPPEVIKLTAEQYGISEAEAKAKLDEEFARCEYWVNDRYQVEKRNLGGWVQLNIRALDGQAIMRDWRHFQEIKNQLVGEECEGLELYPAESRLVDTSNKYHLWVCTDPTFRLKIGFAERDVQYEKYTEAKSPAGLKQRSF